MAKSKHTVKKNLLKKIIAGKNPKAAPFKMDNGLGKNPILAIPDAGSGNGSNLGTNGVF